MAGCAEPAPVEGTRSFLRAIGSHRGVRAGSNSIWVGSLEAGGGGVVTGQDRTDTTEGGEKRISSRLHGPRVEPNAGLNLTISNPVQ